MEGGKKKQFKLNTLKAKPTRTDGKRGTALTRPKICSLVGWPA